MPEKRAKAYRFTPSAERMLKKLRLRLPHMTETAILEAAITHTLGSIERDQPLWVTVPSEFGIVPSGDDPEEDRSA